LIIAEVGAPSNPIGSEEADRSKAIDLNIQRLQLADRIGARCCVNIAGARGRKSDGPQPSVPRRGGTFRGGVRRARMGAMSPNLYAPWRMDYIRSLSQGDDECFICSAVAAGSPEEARDRLVLWRSTHCVVVMNRYPYTNGHLLVAPRAHRAELDDLAGEELLDLQVQSAGAVRLLKRVVSAQGFNIGINIGRCAGAGLPGHIHQHIVPRWAGDTNFMHVIGDTQVVPQAVQQLWQELRDGLGAAGISSA
jgi:ATP adenylyltransferase